MQQYWQIMTYHITWLCLQQLDVGLIGLDILWIENAVLKAEVKFLHKRFLLHATCNVPYKYIDHICTCTYVNIRLRLRLMKRRWKWGYHIIRFSYSYSRHFANRKHFHFHFHEWEWECIKSFPPCLALHLLANSYSCSILRLEHGGS
jgi:hypothetical protein